MKEKEDIRENKWDKLLKIHTMGRDDSNADQYHYPYEPTPYSVLANTVFCTGTSGKYRIYQEK